MVTVTFLGDPRHRARSGRSRRGQRAGQAVRGVPPTADLSLLELATENAELRLQLAEAQDHCV